MAEERDDFDVEDKEPGGTDPTSEDVDPVADDNGVDGPLDELDLRQEDDAGEQDDRATDRLLEPPAATAPAPPAPGPVHNPADVQEIEKLKAQLATSEATSKQLEQERKEARKALFALQAAAPASPPGDGSSPGTPAPSPPATSQRNWADRIGQVTALVTVLAVVIFLTWLLIRSRPGWSAPINPYPNTAIQAAEDTETAGDREAAETVEGGMYRMPSAQEQLQGLPRIESIETTKEKN